MIDDNQPGGQNIDLRTVSGQVRQSNFLPLTGATVRAVDKSLRTEAILGTATTDSQGHYVINYLLELLTQEGKTAADVIVRVLDQNGNVLVESAMQCNAAAQLTVDLVAGGGVYPGPSEYETTWGKIQALIQGIANIELSQNDVDFLACKTGDNREYISYLVSSIGLAHQTGLGAEVFYGFARQNLPVDLPGLLAQDPQVQRIALQSAVNKNIIPAYVRTNLDQTLARLQDLKKQQAFRPPDAQGRTSFGDLIATALPSRELQEAFWSLYTGYQGTTENFWKDLPNHPGFQNPALVTDLRLTLDLGDLTKNHLPLVRALQEMRRGSSWSTAPDLAWWDLDRWKTLIQQGTGSGSIGVPPDIPGNTLEEKIANYSAGIVSQLETTYPTAAIGRKVTEAAEPGNRDLIQFFATNRNFEFGSMPVARYLSAAGESAFAGVSDRQGLTVQLKAMNRVFKLTPQYEQIRPLLADGLNSATRIASMGQEEFVAAYSGTLAGESAARAIHDLASSQAATALTIYTRFASGFNPINTNVMAPVPDSAPEIPEWKTLFGSLELCACEDCRSVLSPAAYLVDLLKFLSGDPKLPKYKNLDLLVGRRPDIGEIELSCTNTNVPVPYIDLVNELLEYEVVRTAFDFPPIPPADFHELWQTRNTAAEVQANPEHLNQNAYSKLRDQVYPPDMPFDLVWEEGRVFMDRLGLPRYQAMEIFQRGALLPGATPSPGNEAIAGEYLGLTATERGILTGSTPFPVYACWGYGPGSADWFKELQPVPALLSRARITFQELLELLAMRFINPEGLLKVVPDSSCVLDEMTIPALSSDALDRMNRFLRLWRKLGWTKQELDRAVIALLPRTGLGTLPPFSDISFIGKIASIQRLQRNLNVPITELLSWWADFDTHVYDVAGLDPSPSPYEQIFLNKTVLQPVDVAFALDSLGKKGLESHVPWILATLGITKEDYAALTGAVSLDPLPGPDPPAGAPGSLTLSNLSQLYRHVSLARALDLSVPDLLSALAITALRPFDSPGNTERFVAAMNRIKGSRFSIADLDYLFRGAARPDSELTLTDVEIESILKTLDSVLLAIQASTEMPPNPSADALTTNLALVLPAARVGHAVQVALDPDEATSADDPKEYLGGFLDDSQLAVLAAMTDTDKTVQQRKRLSYVLEALLAYLHKSLSEAAVIQNIGNQFDIGEPQAALLLRDLVTFPCCSASMPLLGVFQDPKCTPKCDRGGALIVLNKIIALVKALDIRNEDLTWIFQRGPANGLLDWNAIRLSDSEKLFKGWTRLDDAIRLLKSLPDQARPTGKPSPLFAFLQDPGTTIDDRLNKVAKFMGADSGEIKTRADSALPDLLSSPDLPGAVLRLKAAFQTAVSAGMTSEQLQAVIDEDVGLRPEAAAYARQAAKAKYDNAQWLTAVKPLTDALRTKRRDALVSYLTWHLGYKRSNQLFDHFLIDVEMSSCQLTSRIKQAIGAVQLFIQRALMNLEPGVILKTDDIKQWSWMKNYRVWEANRKVFLWPENWIEPELRDDKTPFFEELEDDLQQNDVNPQTAEAAFLSYLRKLDEVARLEIVGMFNESDRNIIHVFGRTMAESPVYYYRRRVVRDDSATWTPWEAVDLDIEGDFLIPVVFERRLYLFWPVFKEVNDPSPPPKNSTDPPKAAKKHLEIRMAHSEYHNGAWLARAVYKTVLSLEAQQDKNYFVRYKVGTFSILSYTGEPDISPLRDFTSQDITFRVTFDSLTPPDLSRAGFTIWCFAGSPVSRTFENRPRSGDDVIYAKFYSSEPLGAGLLLGDFHFDGCHSEPVTHVRSFFDADTAPRINIMPQRSDINEMMYVEEADDPEVDTVPDSLILPRPAPESAIWVLDKTPKVFRILPPDGDTTPGTDVEFDSAKPFFYQDRTKTFFVRTGPAKREVVAR